MSDNQRTSRSRAVARPLIVVLSGLLGIGVAAGTVAFMASTASSASGSTVVLADPSTPTTPTASPSPTKTTVRRAASASPDPSADPTRTSTSSGSTRSSGGSTGSTSTGGGSSSSGATTQPAPAPSEQYCPDTRAQNPSLWDACRAGYVRPSIQYVGVTSCKIVNRAAGEYLIRIAWKLVGGNYAGHYWDATTDQDGGYTVHTHGSQPDWSVTMGTSVGVYFESMNGMPGPWIDKIYSGSNDPTTTVAQACGL